MRRVIVIGFAALAALWSVHRTSAAVVTWEFAGQITSVYDENNLLGGQVVTGTPFSGVFTFETTTPDLAADDPYVGIYGAPDYFLGHVGDATIVGPVDAGPLLSVSNGSSVYPSDAFGVWLVGELLEQRVFVDFGFRDDSGMAFDGDALPFDPFDITDFEHNIFRVRSDEEIPVLVLQGEITSLVPEPGTALLLCVGAVVMLARRGKRRLPTNGRCTGGKA
jgi:hypothetical protein